MSLPRLLRGLHLPMACDAFCVIWCCRQMSGWLWEQFTLFICIHIVWKLEISLWDFPCTVYPSRAATQCRLHYLMCQILFETDNMCGISRSVISSEDVMLPGHPCYLTRWYLSSAADDSWYIWHVYREDSSLICFCHNSDLMMCRQWERFWILRRGGRSVPGINWHLFLSLLCFYVLSLCIQVYKVIPALNVTLVLVQHAM